MCPITQPPPPLVAGFLYPPQHILRDERKRERIAVREAHNALAMQPVVERTTQLVNSFRDDFIKEGWTAITTVKMDHVIDTIIRHVEADHTDLLVVGSRPLSKHDRLRGREDKSRGSGPWCGGLF